MNSKVMVKDDRSMVKPSIDVVEINNEFFYKISNSDAMRPFFMSIVSDSNHWMFISSNGGLSAGRKNADNALFPYYTDDKITESAEITGSKSLFLVRKDGKTLLWEPFSNRYQGVYRIVRNLYKNTFGNKILFEEVNHDLDLTFRYQWNSSNTYGFVRRCVLTNNAQSNVEISVLDGIQNILPQGVSSELQNQASNLVDAYKRSELDQTSGLGIFGLSAIIVDKAEPSEALKANIAWSLGFDQPKHLLSSLQLDNFRKGLPLQEEWDIKAEKGAYLVNEEIVLAAQASKNWVIVCNVNQRRADLARIIESINNDGQLESRISQDVDLGTQRLIKLNASADGLQQTADPFQDTRHFSNSLYNIMRGGVMDHNYSIEKLDFKDYLSKANQNVLDVAAALLDDLPEIFSLSELLRLTSEIDDNHFKRLCLEYMPLKFSRRHGDPSRPWNKFSINTHHELDGSKILDYQGNWRDIFQNWEALAHSFPGFLESMIHKFLNASTFDGYNPYRVTKAGIDWETDDPDDPWSYIGYWGDHQIIYLLKFLELLQDRAPGKLEYYLDKEFFVYANVPYRIKSYHDIIKNPKDTIEFNQKSDQAIQARRKTLGADAVLLRDKNGSIIQVNFIEKILATVLAKMSNFIPEGGIWMNTQRPEWNDANNALVGNGVSMVTLCYLRRFLQFFKKILHDDSVDQVRISTELLDFFKGITDILEKNQSLLSGRINDKHRKLILDGLGKAASTYRHHIYDHAFNGDKKVLFTKDLRSFIALSLDYLDHSIQANKRSDRLYHAYNLMTVGDESTVTLSHLSEMLEGQVAVLSSGYLSSTEAMDVMDSLRSSALYREDQNSYLLYPNKNLPGFMEKNHIPKPRVEASKLLLQLVQDGNIQVIEEDINGDFHFNGDFNNAHDLEEAIKSLADTKYGPLIKKEQNLVLRIFEEVFNHKAFTGRSGTFFGYEGLGSIYWHMVSKLRLAVQECCVRAVEGNESEEIIDGLVAHYYEIAEGIGVHKPPSVYGAFPIDPYSHTPAGKGAQQPGMTGQVKEDIICRFGEFGVNVKEGKLNFNPYLLRKEEFLRQPAPFEYVNVNSEHKQLQLKEGSLAFTYCQIPVIYHLAEGNKVELVSGKDVIKVSDVLQIDPTNSRQVFERTGDITQINVHLEETMLR